MPEELESKDKTPSPDWFVHGILTKLGDMFDRFLGRGWQPSSNIATSELVGRLKELLDAEAVGEEKDGKFVPHIIQLKVQWDRFATDDSDALIVLENELLTAVVDHINDRRYYTHGPLNLKVKPDYFTEGIKFLLSFDEIGLSEREVEIVPGQKESEKKDEVSDKGAVAREVEVVFALAAAERRKILTFPSGERVTVGRTAPNGLVIDDESVSKMHASLAFDDKGHLILADTGSTNGTFLNGERIPYGKALTVADGETVKFGSVPVTFTIRPGADRSAQHGDVVESKETAIANEAGVTSGELPVAETTGQIGNTPGPSHHADASTNEAGPESVPTS